MPLSVSSPENVINLALVRIGFKGRVNSIYEGSEASKLALDIYSQTRDELLRQSDWGFAERNVPLTLQKQAPAGGYIPPLYWTSIYPALPWFFQYGYPQDCLKIRALKPTPLFIPNFDPQTNVFTVANDNSFTPAQKVILCNVPLAILTYTAQVTDMTTWEADFVETFVSSIARRLAPSLVGLDTAKLEASDEAAAKAQAEMEQG